MGTIEQCIEECEQEAKDEEGKASPLQRRVICSHANHEKCYKKCRHIKPHVGSVCDVEEHEIYDCEELGMCKRLKIEVYCKSI